MRTGGGAWTTASTTTSRSGTSNAISSPSWTR
jgi:hypothetical protein